MKETLPLNQWLLIGLIVALGQVSTLSDILMLSPVGALGSHAMFVYFLYPLIQLAGIFGGFVCLMICSCTKRPMARRVMAYAAILIISMFAGILVNRQVRIWMFRGLAERSKPVLAAIANYEDSRGHPPQDLKALVPDFLSRIPGTGMSAYPAYEYELVTDVPNQRWELRVPCTDGFANWDVFFYWPTENYPERTYGGPVERVGKWAYVHE